MTLHGHGSRPRQCERGNRNNLRAIKESLVSLNNLRREHHNEKKNRTGNNEEWTFRYLRDFCSWAIVACSKIKHKQQ